MVASAKRKALITGASGQDGSYLAEKLLSLGYEVHCVLRNHWFETEGLVPPNLNNSYDHLHLHAGSLENVLGLSRIVREVMPDECYHLAGYSFVEVPFEEEPTVLASLVSGTHALLAAIREFVPECRFFLAGSSEMIGAAPESPQSETTACRPRSIYGLSKLSGFHIARFYREKYGIYAVTGILYNHESVRRGPQFVTRKITQGAAAIKLGRQKSLSLGNIDAVRDWGYAPDYIDAIYRMVQGDEPKDFVIATGVGRTVRDLLEVAFGTVGIDWQDHVVIEPKFYREIEAVPLIGDARAIELELGWNATKPFSEIIEEMVVSDLQFLQKA